MNFWMLWAKVLKSLRNPCVRQLNRIETLQGKNAYRSGWTEIETRLKFKSGVLFADKDDSRVDAFGVHCNCAPIISTTVPRALHMGIFHIQEVEMLLRPGKS